ncbi:putative 2-keto-4-pentenoate hydratase [Nocardia nova SH22a]|uniref:Putative 2-keto-4-pentenoate hydratase n=1 Tax=Nocardia nova SH22a TaxID=1415166 RepID=W5TG13_9NOCA|nr:fumarylacetoacetate hydrolase family protein [Nocardia nova]AHH18295.1 putative 2-keto-4-pentenoate hydratase [Nocardia nova SH22a]
MARQPQPSTVELFRALDVDVDLTADNFAAAERLFRAGRADERVRTTDIAELTADNLDDAYRIQRINIRKEINEGRSVVGYKVGLTSEAMQQQLRTAEPDSGILLDRMVQPSGCTVDKETLFSGRIEAEFAVELSPTARPDQLIDEAGIRSNISRTMLALEVLDTRYESWLISLWHSIADNASCAMAVVGTPTEEVWAEQLKDLTIDVFVDGEKRDSGKGSAVLGDPINSVVWLARQLKRSGLSLHPGDIVITGSVHASIALEGVSEVVARSHSHDDVVARFR